MKFICPTLGNGAELDFLAIGNYNNFKIVVFSDLNQYKSSFKHLKLVDYKPKEVSFNLFYNLAKNDNEFQGLILNIIDENKIIHKNEIIEMKKINL